MSINYTSLLALIQPVDGTEVGVWGDDVNNGVSSILDVAVAGTQNITTDANVTLTITQATSSGTNLSSTSAQYAILLLSGARTATRTVTLPASSKTYTVMNSTTGGYAQTVGGLTIAVGEYCQIAYNTSSSSWVKTSTQSGSGVFTTVTATVAYQGDFSNSTLLSRTLFTTTTANSTTGIYAVPSGTATAASWQATNAADPTNASKILIATNGSTDVQLVSGRNGTGTYLPLSFYTNGSQQAQLDTSGNFTLSNGNITLSAGTANGVAYLNGSKVLTTGSALTFDGTNFGAGVANFTGSVFVGSGGKASSGSAAFIRANNGYSTASTPDYTFWYEDSTGIFHPAANQIGFTISGSEQMRLTSTGLGIGTNSPSAKITVYATNNTANFQAGNNSNTNGGGAALKAIDRTDNAGGGTTGYGLYTGSPYDGTNASGNTYALTKYGLYVDDIYSYYGLNSAAGNANWGIYVKGGANNYIAGNLLVGTTSSTTTPASGVQLNNGSSIGTVAVGHASGTATGNYFATFSYNSGIIGSITQNGISAVLYNTSSDQRLKDNIKDAADAASLIDSLQVRQFDWKADGSHQRYGFVAQELVTVAPEAVYQPTDPEEMMAVDYSKLVPMLVKEVQSLRARLKAANIA